MSDEIEKPAEVIVVETTITETVVIVEQHYAPTPGLLEAFTGLLPIITVAIFIITFIVQPFRIPSGSMERTLRVGDFLLVNKQVLAPAGAWHWLLPYRNLRRGDIVVFHHPLEPDEHLIKRTIGLPGERLRLRGGRVFINGQPLEEGYTVYSSTRPDNFRDNFPSLRDADPEIDAQWWMQMRTLIDNGDLIIPAGNAFMMGDNRNNSQDSRYWGFMPDEFAEGEPLLIYFSVRSPYETGGHVRWDRVMTIPR